VAGRSLLPNEDVFGKVGCIAIEGLFGADQRPKKSFRRAWRRVCLAAGLPGRIPHDFRRTAVRNLERAGVGRSVAMELVGHKTESIYQRYDIVAERDLTDSMARYAARLRVGRDAK
jgi:integrase